MSSFHCDTLDTRVTKPCQLKACRFNINNPNSFNCLLHYSATNDTPSIAEVAYFYGMPLSKAREIYKTAVEKIYEKVISDRLNEKVRVNYLPSTEICLHCESFVEEPVMVQNAHVICKECSSSHPMTFWSHAVKYATTVEEIRDSIFNLFKNNVLIDKFLDLPKGTAKKLRSRFYGSEET